MGVGQNQTAFVNDHAAPEGLGDVFGPAKIERFDGSSQFTLVLRYSQKVGTGVESAEFPWRLGSRSSAVAAIVLAARHQNAGDGRLGLCDRLLEHILQGEGFAFGQPCLRVPAYRQ